MPDETINTGIPVVAEVLVEPVLVEPTIVAELEPVAVVEPAIESASLGNPEEVSATRIGAFPDAPLSENIDSPVVAEAQVVPEPESLISVPAEPMVEAVVSIVGESIQAPEQPAETAQPSVPVPVGDLVLTPQTVQFEALKPEIPPEISPIEQVYVPAVPAQSAFAVVPPIVRPLNIFLSLISKGRATIQVHKRKKLDRIIGLFAKQASITNDDAEKLLHISDATASRYLGILEKEGKVKQVGPAGRWVSYVKA